MKILLDENLPHGFRQHLSGHDVRTVAYQQWAGLKNGQLMAAALAAGFDAMLTMDQGIQHQRSAANRPLAVVFLHAPTNDIDDLIPLMPVLLRALEGLTPGDLVHVSAARILDAG